MARTERSTTTETLTRAQIERVEVAAASQPRDNQDVLDLCAAALGYGDPVQSVRSGQTYRQAHTGGSLVLCREHAETVRGVGECQDAREMSACEECARLARGAARRQLASIRWVREMLALGQ